VGIAMNGLMEFRIKNDVSIAGLNVGIIFKIFR